MRNCARSVTCARCYRRRGSSGGARAPQNSVQSAAARDAPREGCGGGVDECLDWFLLLLPHTARVFQKTRGKPPFFGRARRKRSARTRTCGNAVLHTPTAQHYTDSIAAAPKIA